MPVDLYKNHQSRRSLTTFVEATVHMGASRRQSSSRLGGTEMESKPEEGFVGSSLITTQSRRHEKADKPPRTIGRDTGLAWARNTVQYDSSILTFFLRGKNPLDRTVRQRRSCQVRRENLSEGWDSVGSVGSVRLEKTLPVEGTMPVRHLERATGLLHPLD